MTIYKTKRDGKNHKDNNYPRSFCKYVGLTIGLLVCAVLGLMTLAGCGQTAYSPNNQDNQNITQPDSGNQQGQFDPSSPNQNDPSGPQQPVAVELEAPANLVVGKTSVTWDAVENANSYEVYINGDVHQCLGTSFQFQFEEEKTYDVEVRAIGDGTAFTSSDWTESEDIFFETQKSQSQLVEEALVSKLSSAFEQDEGVLRCFRNPHIKYVQAVEEGLVVGVIADINGALDAVCAAEIALNGDFSGNDIVGAINGLEYANITYSYSCSDTQPDLYDVIQTYDLTGDYADYLADGWTKQKIIIDVTTVFSGLSIGLKTYNWAVVTVVSVLTKGEQTKLVKTVYWVIQNTFSTHSSQEAMNAFIDGSQKDKTTITEFSCEDLGEFASGFYCEREDDQAQSPAS